MAPKKKATAASAPASRKPVRRKDGLPTLAEKRAAKKAEHAAVVDSAKLLVKTAVQEQRKLGRLASSESVAKIIGKPVEWSDDLNEALYALISTGHGMREISEMEGMPPLYQMLKWLADETHPFTICRARAKDMLVPLYEETAQAIGMKPNTLRLKTRKQIVTKDGDVVWVTEYRESDNVERSKLALQTLQWTLGHLKPKKHGRNPDPSTGGANEQLKGLFDALKAGPADAQ